MTEGLTIKDKGVAPDYRNDDGSTLPVKLPFKFCFYGRNYDTVFANNNGIISFKKPICNFKNTGAQYGKDTIMVAPFYSDVNTLDPFASGLVYYKMTATHLIIKWDAVGYEGPDDDFFNSYQLIITDGNDPILPAGSNVSFCYYNMGWASSDVWGGFGGFGGISSIVGLSKGNGVTFALFGTYSLPGTTFYGPSDPYNGVQWLNQKSFLFNTCLSQTRIPPVMIKDGYTCDTISVCAGGQTTFTTSFLYAEQGQKSILTASSPGLTGLTVVDTTTSAGIGTIKVKVAPSTGNIGTYQLTITSTDNGSPALTTKRTFVINVDVCTNVKESDPDAGFAIYPVPCDGRFIIDMSVEQPLVDSDIKIFSMLGNEIYSSKINRAKTEIDISGISKGIYFLTLYRDNVPMGVKKIILH